MSTGKKGAPGALTTEVGKIILGELAYRGKLQKDLYEVTGISKSMMSSMLKGDKHITLSDLDKICYAIDRPISEVLEQAAKKTSGRYAEDSWDVARL